MDDCVLKLEGVSKKFCRDLKRSLWYGLSDIGRDLCGMKRGAPLLRSSEFWAVEDLDLTLRPGESIALLGANGAGKSTVLKMINGLYPPDRGRILVKGRVGALLDLGTGFKEILTGRENIYVNAAILGMSRKQIEKQLGSIVEFAELDEFLDAPLLTYSAGMKVRLGFSIAIHLCPDLLLVDEVLAVGDIRFRTKCYQRMHELLRQGAAIILVSHHVEQLSRVAERSIVLHRGKKLFEGSLMDGISHYYGTLQSGPVHRALPKALNPCIGSVNLVDRLGRPIDLIQPGEDAFFDMDFRTNIPLQEVVLVVELESASVGTLGTFSNPQQNYAISLSPPQTKVRLSLPAIPLQLGTYRLNLSVYDSGLNRCLDHRSPVATFRVGTSQSGSLYFNEVFRFRHRWEMLPT